LQTVTLHIRYRSLLGERQKTGHNRHDRDRCYSEAAVKKGKGV